LLWPYRYHYQEKQIFNFLWPCRYQEKHYLFFVALQVSGKTELEEVQFSCSLEQLQVNIPM
jgi:hypothetical protein